ncbi:IS3 family transposase [Pseudomonas sp. SMSB3]|uniref:IS3 family transposase n=1 Tax=Pseudomonas sp. SMSB3 TaxID=3390196 RepID=UPI003F85DE70
MRYAFVAAERTRYPVRVLCRVMEVSVSGFYDFTHRRLRPDPDNQVRIDLRSVFAASRNTYGRPRLVAALRQKSHSVGHKRVRRLMQEEHIRAKSKGGFRPCTTDSSHHMPVAGNVLDRQFSIDNPTPTWVSDITYLPTKEGWLYLAVVLSIQTRQVLGYSLSDRMPDTLVENAFLNAWNACSGTGGEIFHSDQGRQYASGKFRQTLASKDVQQSMSRRENCWDNAVAESFFATLKREEACGVYPTKRHAQLGIASYVHGFYNSSRLHSALGYRSPNDYARWLKQKAV